MKENKMTHKIKLSFFASCAIFASATLTHAADVPTVGNQPQLIDIPEKQKPEPKINIKLIEDPLSEIAKDSNKTLLINDYKFAGDKLISAQELNTIVEPYKNKELNIKDIMNITKLITKKYQDSGYIVASAYIAPKSYKDGVLTISTICGTYGGVKLSNSSLVSDSTINAIFNSNKGEYITSASLERSVLLTSDLAGVTVENTDLTAGAKTGESDLVVTTKAAPRFDGYATFDNYGSVYTGLYEYAIGANANSPLGIGDKLSVTGMLTTGGGSKNGSVNYGAPIMSNGLNLSAGYYQNQYALGNDYAALNSVGTTSAVQANLSYPVIRSKLENLNISANPQMQLLGAKQLGENTQKRAGLAVFGANYSKQADIGLPVSFSTNSSYTLGNLTFKDSNDAGLDMATTQTSGTFSKISTSTTAAIALTDALSFKNVFNAQYALAKKNLDGSQAITIGGAYAVRAFPTTQESSSNGYVYTAELGYQLPAIQNYTHNLSAFYDVGRAYMSNNNSPSGYIPFNAQILQDVGIGYSMYYKGLFAKVQLAQVVGGVKVQGVQYYTTKALFQVGLSW